MTLVTILSYVSGLGFVAPDLAPATVVGTTLALHTCDAIMCRLVAHNNGHPKTLWTALGFIAGIWAFAVLILLPRRAAAPASAGPLR
jgi:hypothetical protein